jgi:hypothetical protein
MPTPLLDEQLAKSNPNTIIQGWQTNGLRSVIEHFIPKGIPTLFTLSTVYALLDLIAKRVGAKQVIGRQRTEENMEKEKPAIGERLRKLLGRSVSEINLVATSLFLAFGSTMDLRNRLWNLQWSLKKKCSIPPPPPFKLCTSTCKGQEVTLSTNRGT